MDSGEINFKETDMKMDINSGRADVSLDNEEFFRRYGRSKTVAAYTLGCKVNQYETEALLELFENQGYEAVDFEDKADVYLVNTCTVTGLSARKSRQIIRRAKSANEASIVIAAGCYSQTAPGEVMEIPSVDLVLGTKDRSRIMEFVGEIASKATRINAVSNIMAERSFENLGVTKYNERTRAFLKIQEGCTQFCSYCIIPYARGPVRSRPEAEVLEEVEKLAESGFKEIVLTGIHTASYGRDLKNTSLLQLLRKVDKIEGISRVRLGSIEPTTITPEFVSAAVSMSKLCPHYHISLQSGCDATLKRMNRKYTTEDYRKSVRLLRENIEGVAVTTDVMVGFPGETEEEFAQTYSFLEEIGFAQMHVFKYSPRKGTPAAGFQDQVSSEVKEERSRKVLDLAAKLTMKFNSGFTGKNIPVLFEQEVKSMAGYVEGLTSNYIKVVCNGNNNIKGIKGEIKEARLLKAVDDYVLGELQASDNSYRTLA